MFFCVFLTLYALNKENEIMINGQFISTIEKANTFVIEKDFEISSFKTAELKITALGLYKVEINGHRVSDYYMTPGFTSYNKMVQLQRYDISSLLKEGTNHISITVNAGWYCSGVMGPGYWYKFGDAPAVIAEIVVDSKSVLTTDTSWDARESFIRFSGIYDGETQDFVSPRKSLTPSVKEYDKSKIVEQIVEPVRDIERLSIKEIIKKEKNRAIYDFGQNMTGVVELHLPKGFVGTITLRFSEILINNELYVDNLRHAKVTDTFIVKGQTIVVPEFTFHGFRYLEVNGIDLDIKDISAIVRHTDLRRTGHIEVGHPRLQRLIDNVVWGQRDNYLDIPTDCPQRDERMGWTGDANVFCKTAAFNYDVRMFFKKWLRDMRNDQYEDGRISIIVPDTLETGETASIWCDSIIMIPYKLYEIYDDLSYLEDNYEAMKKYLQAQENTLVNGLVGKGHQFGDWLSLDEIPQKQENYYLYFIANAFYYHCLKTVENISKILKNEEFATICAQKADELLTNIRKEYYQDNGLPKIDTVTALVLTLQLELVEEKNHQYVADKLNEEIIKRDYHVTTGFIGTAYLLFALADNGFLETAKKVMMVEGMPGWLYEVDMGATTIWERWNSLLPDGTPNPDGMNSYNHYAYGVVMEFIYRRIVGIEPLTPGFKEVKIIPSYISGVDHVKGEFQSINGKIVSSYKIANNTITYSISIPKGIKAGIYLPNEGLVASGSGEFVFERTISK